MTTHTREKKSQTIYESGRYIASAMNDGSLVVQTKLVLGGRRLVGIAAAKGIAAIRTAIDRKQADTLCRALIDG